MRIRYPFSFSYLMVLSLAIAALTMVWNLMHMVGLIAVLAGVFLLPAVVRWEARR